jgi:hypothetical protein
MVMGFLLSVVIDIINVLRVSIEAKNHPPVGPNSHGPKAFLLAFERMQLQLRLVYVSNGLGGMECRQNIPQLVGMLRIHAPWVVLLKKPFQPLVANGPYHSLP